MHRILIKNATLVNEGIIAKSDVLIENDRIAQIAESISVKSADTKVIDADGLHLLPGMIDDQVHFREPGLTHKATIATESKAAVAGGITTFIEMPNTVPQATTVELLEQKFKRASETSWANYSFMFGGTNDNLEEIMKVDPQKVAGLKLFLGSSTGNMLVDDPEVLEEIFSKTNLLISAHCEDEATIRTNLEKFKTEYGDDIPIASHPVIRSEEACYLSSSRAIELAKKTGARLHVFHLSTEKETHLFDNSIPLSEKKITAEVCIHHLWFTTEDYAEKGTFIKWNPAVKKATDRAEIIAAVNDNRIDVIATDHAPHTIKEKQNSYFSAPSGGPLVQHSLLALLDMYHNGDFTLEKIVEKSAHAVAEMFDIEERGFIREGFFADLVIVDINKDHEVQKSNLLYKCGWSPFEGHTFKSTVDMTLVNGRVVYENGLILEQDPGMRMTFDR